MGFMVLPVVKPSRGTEWLFGVSRIYFCWRGAISLGCCLLDPKAAPDGLGSLARKLAADGLLALAAPPSMKGAWGVLCCFYLPSSFVLCPLLSSLVTVQRKAPSATSQGTHDR
jgi:hypothetical protein